MTRIYRNEDVLWREEDEAQAEAYDRLAEDGDVIDMGTSILFDEGRMIALNLLGTEIWKLCDGRSVEEIVLELIEQFEVESDILRTDVEIFLADLTAKGLIRHGE